MASSPYKPQIIIKNGKPVAVIVGIEEYEALLEEAEQAEDLRAIQKMKSRDWQTMSFDEYLRGKRRRVSA